MQLIKMIFYFLLIKRIYPYKNNGNVICNDKDDYPRFRYNDIKICSNCVKEKNSYTSESNSNYSCYNYNGDNNA